MTNTARNKGTRIEREIATKLTELGIPTRRVIGSGAHGHIDSRLEGDLQIGTHGPHDAEWLLTGEVKARKGAAGWKVLEGWLADNDLLLLRRNHAEPYAFMPWRTLVPLLDAFYREKKQHLTLTEKTYGSDQHSGGDMSSTEHLHGGEK
jgi:hypothetical protein